MRRALLLIVAALLAAAPAEAAVTRGWAPAASMSGARAFHSAVLLTNGKVLVAGGDTPAGLGTRGAELFDPATGTWAPAGSMIVARTSFALVRLANGKVLAAGGYNGAAGTLNSAELYDPATNAWSAVGSLSVARNRPAATLLANGKVLVSGGYGTGDAHHASAEAFDPATNSWSPAGTFAVSRFDHSAALLTDGRALIAGGFNGAIHATGSLYSPAANGWGNAASMTVPRSLFGLTRLPSGKVLATGGDNSGGRLNSAELYDPAANAWTPAATMSAIHYRHTATLLNSGKILIAAGLQGPSAGTVAELYDPVSNNWTPAGTLGTARFQHTATRLNDGRVLITGGFGPTPTASAETWTPATSLAADPAVAFGDGAVGASVTGAIQITNTGDSPLLTADFALGGAHPAEFGLDNRCPAAVAPAATCVLGVRFAPAAAGPRGATLTFSANTASGTHAVSLSGRGVAPPTPAPRRISVTLNYDYKVGKRSTRFPRLVVRGVPAGSTVTATCAKGCARKRYVKRNARGTVSLKPIVSKPPKAKSKIVVTVTRPNAIGAVKILTVRAGKRPSLSTRCLPPGAKSPRACR